MLLWFLEEKFFPDIGKVSLGIGSILFSAAAAKLIDITIKERENEDVEPSGKTTILIEAWQTFKSIMAGLEEQKRDFIIVLLTLFIVPAFLSSLHLGGRLQSGIKAGYVAFVSYTVASEENGSVAESAEEAGSPELKEIEETKDTEGAKENVQKHETESENPIEPSVKADDLSSTDTLADKICFESGELMMEWALSEEEYNQIFFVTGEFAIQDWNNPVHIKDQLEAFVDSLQAEGLCNVFDNKECGAPSYIQSEIVKASEEEEKIKSLSGQMEIIRIREEAFASYPKYSLAKLTAEGYHACAQAFTKHGGNVETIRCFTGQSILWRFQGMKFVDISNGILKINLNSACARYKELSDTYPEWSEERKHALAIAAGFEELYHTYERNGGEK